MRKRIVIGFLAVVMIAGTAFFILQPKLGTLDWHKREYVKASDLMYGDRTVDTFWRLKEKIAGRNLTQIERIGPDEFEAAAVKMQGHRTALIACGYLIEQSFVTTNAASLVSARLWRSRRQAITRENRKYAEIGYGAWHSHTVMVTARPEDMPAWEHAIRRMDFP